LVSRSGTPAQYWCGWFDACTPEGAARRFVQMKNPMNVIIGPWPHGYDKPYDPLRPDNKEFPPAAPAQMAQVIRFADLCLNGQAAGQRGKVLHYYTLGEGVWKSTRSWPIPATRRRWYMASGFRLSSSPDETGSDSFQVDPELGDVTSDRWTSASSTKVNYGDRREFDAARLAYTSEPLTSDLEITGHPVAHLNITSSREDGNFFVYLEAVRPDGVSCYLTEGQLRALHRKVWTDSPFTALGPQHSCLKRDAEPLTPGEPAILTFALQPISALLPRGYRLRVCLAGSNKTRFANVPADGAPPKLDFRRGSDGCHIDLPIIGS
jgi:putative CocE/NonD family hydrolase